MVCLQPGRLVRGHREGHRVRLAEAVRPEGLHDLPGPADHLLRVAALGRLRREPDLDPRLRLRVGQPAPHPVRLVPPAAGHDVHDLDDLLVEDHHPVRLAQRVGQVRVREADRGPPVPGLDEGPHHVGRHRPRPEQRDVDDQVVEGGRLQPPHQVPLARRFDLEAAQGLGRADQLVRGPVARWHLRRVVQVELPPRATADLRDRVGHRGLHPHAQHVQFEQPELLHVVFVELGHGEALAAGGHHRRTGEQGVVGEQHPARVHGDPARQRVQRFDELPQPPVRLPPYVAQFGELLQRGTGVAGPDVSYTHL